MNSQLGYGVYGLSGSGSAIPVLNPPDPTAIVSGSAQQTAVTTASSFVVDLRSDAYWSGPTLGDHLFATSSVVNTLIVSFHLTQQSVLDLTGSLNPKCSFVFDNGCNDLFSQEAEGIDLSGSGFDFSQQADRFTEPFGTAEPFNFSATLNAGDYTLTAWSNPSIHSVLVEDAPFELSLSATFAAIPEPPWTVIVPVSFLAVWHCTSLRRRRRAQSTADPTLC
jgi:hypothetical protein